MRHSKLGACLIAAAFLVGTVNSASAHPASKPTSNIISSSAKVTTSFDLKFSDATKKRLQTASPVTLPKGKVSYQWLKDSRAIRGATKATYVVADLDRESRFQLRITFAAEAAKPKVITSKAFVPADQPKSYNLLWSDEFDGLGSELSAANWIAQDGDGTAFNLPGWGNNEEQFYKRSQALVKNGTMTINATRTGASAEKCYYGACTWLSSKFVTKDKIGFQYGRLEARVRTSTGTGVWPAFWLLGANIDTRSWPGCGEIDIMELKGQEPNRVWGTLHGPNGSLGDVGALASGMSDWHTYAIDWTPTSITWFVDGKAFKKITKAQYVNGQDPRVWVFDHEFYLILNLALGGNFVGGPSDPSINAAQSEYDYVRYYSIDGLGILTQK